MCPHVDAVSFNIHFAANAQHLHPRLVQILLLNNQDLICCQNKAALQPSRRGGEPPPAEVKINLF